MSHWWLAIIYKEFYLVHASGGWEVQEHGTSIYSTSGEDLLAVSSMVEGITW
jgi:hypothetical protein